MELWRAVDAQKWSRWGTVVVADFHHFTEEKDPDPQHIERCDPGPHQSEKVDPDLHQVRRIGNTVNSSDLSVSVSFLLSKFKAPWPLKCTKTERVHTRFWDVQVFQDFRCWNRNPGESFLIIIPPVSRLPLFHCTGRGLSSLRFWKKCRTTVSRLYLFSRFEDVCYRDYYSHWNDPVLHPSLWTYQVQSIGSPGICMDQWGRRLEGWPNTAARLADWKGEWPRVSQ